MLITKHGEYLNITLEKIADEAKNDPLKLTLKRQRSWLLEAKDVKQQTSNTGTITYNRLQGSNYFGV